MDCKQNKSIDEAALRLTSAEIEKSLEEHLPALLAEDSLWVFASGSLLWNPGFDYEEKQETHIRGWHRLFGLYSIHYRGTATQPGLVTGLDRGGAVKGIAFRVVDKDRISTLRCLWERELITGAYWPKIIRCDMRGEKQSCLAFVLNRTHPQYADGIDDKQRAELIIKAQGRGGSNRDYLEQVFRALKNHGIKCGHTERLMRYVDIASIDASSDVSSGASSG